MLAIPSSMDRAQLVVGYPFLLSTFEIHFTQGKGSHQKRLPRERYCTRKGRFAFENAEKKY